MRTRRQDPPDIDERAFEAGEEIREAAVVLAELIPSVQRAPRRAQQPPADAE
jgi:hypothetical protein